MLIYTQNITTIRKNTEALLDISKDFGLKVKAEAPFLLSFLIIEFSNTFKDFITSLIILTLTCSQAMGHEYILGVSGFLLLFSLAPQPNLGLGLHF
jgi:hypothetical protein